MSLKNVIPNLPNGSKSETGDGLGSFKDGEGLNTPQKKVETSGSIEGLVNVKPVKVIRRKFKTSSHVKTSLGEEFEFENLEANTIGAAPVGASLVNFVLDACTTVEEMVAMDPAKEGEVDGIEIVGYMDGVRIVNRLKKKLETEVDLYCSGQSLESSPKDGARTK